VDIIKRLLFIFLALIMSGMNSQAGVKTISQDLKDENIKIELLIQSIEQLEGAQFYRNGSWYDAKTAATHLRMKLSKAGTRVKTAHDFIDKIGTESSITGEVYKIKFADGKIITAREYFSSELKKIESTRALGYK